MTNKELKEKIENIPEDKYIYQRYNGEITKYRDDGEHYINCEIGLAFKKDGNLFHGKISENLIDLIEVGDIVNGYRILEIYEKTAEDEERILDIGYGMAIFNEDVKTILTYELYEKNCYRVGGE